MKTRIIALLLALFTLIPIPAYAQAPTAGQVRSAANLRSGPGTDNAIVGHASAGDSLQISGCNDDCTWYQLADGNWIAAFLVDATTTAAVAPAATSAPAAAPAASCPSATVTANIRSGPGTTFDIISQATPGACIVITGRTDAGDWYQLSDSNWIFAELVTNAGTPPVVSDTRTEVIQIATAEPQAQPAAPAVTPVPPTPEPQQATAPIVSQPSSRVGATCVDGSSSGATGRGACSHHGGVSCWRMSDGACVPK